MCLNVCFLGGMGLEPHGIISDTNEQDLPASVEAHKDSSVVPKSVAIPRKRKYRSVSSVQDSTASEASSAVDVASVTTGTEVGASQKMTAAVDVVASIHSYAMPGYMCRPTKFTPRHTTAISASCDDDKSASNNASNAVNTVKQPVSLHHPNMYYLYYY